MNRISTEDDLKAYERRGRIVAQLGCKPRDVSVHRIQVQSYAAR